MSNPWSERRSRLFRYAGIGALIRLVASLVMWGLASRQGPCLAAYGKLWESPGIRFILMPDFIILCLSASEVGEEMGFATAVGVYILILVIWAVLGLFFLRVLGTHLGCVILFVLTLLILAGPWWLFTMRLVTYYD